MKKFLKEFSLILLFLILSACTHPTPEPNTTPETTFAIETIEEGREVFLEALQSQLGSSGQILPDGERYAAWFARRQNYRVEPWEDEDVAWCVCFLYWGLAQCEDHVIFDFDDPLIRTADVDLFCQFFGEDRWKTEGPQPGDIVFFDTDPEDDDPTVNHAGAVLKVDGPTIYIIEGNTLRGQNHPTGTAAQYSYSLDDPRILGYGELDWK